MRVLDRNLLRVTDTGWDLVGQKCASCGKIAFPRKRVCPECFSSELGEFLLSHRGTLHTYTTTYLGSPSLDPPYTMGFLDLPEGIKLMSIIKVPLPADDHLQVGMPMDIVLDKLRTDPDGEDVYFYVFKPSAREAAR